MVTPSRGGVTQGNSSRPSHISTSWEEIEDPAADLSEKKCRGCDFDKSSLRGHLARTTKGCKNLYTAAELKELKENAKAIHKEQIAVWKKDRGQRSEVGAPQEDPPVKSPRSIQGPPIAFEKKCRGCDFKGKSLRGHLVRTTKDCHKFYSKEDLDELRHHADYVRRDQTAEWIKRNRKTAIDVCNICDKKFVDKHVLDRHMTEVHNPEPIPCTKCPKSFLRKDELRNHLHTEHAIKDELFSHSTECTDCKKKFTRRDKLDRHEAEVHDKIIKFFCTDCKFSFARKENLDRHVSDVHKELINWTCNLCPRDSYRTKAKSSKDSAHTVLRSQFSRFENLQQHLNEVHHKEKRWHCNLCPQKYARWAKLNRHISVEHEGMKLFICPVCSRHFNWIEKLNRHMNDVHKEEKNYECEGCNEKFSRMENLIRHQKTPCFFLYECQFCHEEGLHFKTETEARKHFLFDPRSKMDDKRPKSAYSCVNHEKEKRKRAEEYRHKGTKTTARKA